VYSARSGARQRVNFILDQIAEGGFMTNVFIVRPFGKKSAQVNDKDGRDITVEVDFEDSLRRNRDNPLGDRRPETSQPIALCRRALREPRRTLHARIAETLESQFTEIAENQPELLARLHRGWAD
jgi:hypothetical protein